MSKKYASQATPTTYETKRTPIFKRLFLFVLFAWLAYMAFHHHAEEPADDAVIVAEAAEINQQPEVQPQEPEQQGDYELTINEGDSLSSIFDRYQISANDLHEIMRLKEVKHVAAQMRPGQTVHLVVDGHKRLQKMVYHVDTSTSLYVTRPDPVFVAHLKRKPPETRQIRAHTKIQRSLFQSGHEAHIPDKILMQLTELFSWQLDFAKDIRSGDSFSLVYERDFIGDRPIHTGQILAAEIHAHSRTLRAVRFKDKHGVVKYYTPEGHSLQKAFIRTPVKYRRISSPYNPNRMHPILNIKRPHLGVDLAAPRGTPIKASGDGKVTFAGRKGGYGNAIKIQHGHQISTLYAHMSRFAKGIHAGTWVKQGQVIGYVGSTGLANGPHLHYEYRINGKTYNPMKVKLPEADQLSPNELQIFVAQAKPLLLALADENTPQYAANEQPKESKHAAG